MCVCVCVFIYRSTGEWKQFATDRRVDDTWFGLCVSVRHVVTVLFVHKARGSGYVCKTRGRDCVYL